MLVTYLIASLAYLTVSIYLFWTLIQKKSMAKHLVLALLLCALVAHLFTLYPSIVTLYGLNFNIFNTLSLISLFFIVFFTIFCLYRPILSLGTLAAPLALMGLSVGFFGKAPYRPLTNISLGLEIHIILSLAAYCALLMAAIQAITLRLQIRELKHRTAHRFWVAQLPSLQSMEDVLFDMILMGFVLLTAALSLGFVYVHDIFAQHITHKTVFSIISWLVFGGLLIGHWRLGWRGQRAANMTIYGFILLALGFVGSKIVLELIL